MSIQVFILYTTKLGYHSFYVLPIDIVLQKFRSLKRELSTSFNYCYNLSNPELVFLLYFVINFYIDCAIFTHKVSLFLYYQDACFYAFRDFFQLVFFVSLCQRCSIFGKAILLPQPHTMFTTSLTAFSIPLHAILPIKSSNGCWCYLRATLQDLHIQPSVVIPFVTHITRSAHHLHGSGLLPRILHRPNIYITWSYRHRASHSRAPVDYRNN